MKKSRLWILPAVFFLIACAVNLYGCVTDNLTLEYHVKGALMPLLALTGLAYLAPREFNVRTAGTLLLAQLVRRLQAFGHAFLLGHLCYLRIFSRTLKGLSAGKWAAAFVTMAAILVCVVLAIGIEGVLLVPMAVYGAALLFIAFCGFCGMCRRTAPSRGTWWMVLAGAILFLASDSLIAMRTFGECDFALRSFTIMSTYLVAQSLLCAAGVRLAVADKK